MPKLLTTPVLWAIVTMHGQNKTIAQIVRECGVSRQAVVKVIRRWQATGDPHVIPRPRRKVATNIQQDVSIRDLAKAEPFMVPRQIRAVLGLNVSLTTIKRRLTGYGLNGRRAATKPSLTADHKQARLLFAQQHRDPFDWTSVIFSDESIICSSDHGVQWVRRPRNRRWEEQYIAANTRGGRVSISVWGMIVVEGAGRLIRVQGRMNSRQYVDRILNTTVIPYCRQHPLRVYMHDNASIHKSAVTKNALRNAGVPTLYWPAKSPDLNPIENYWAKLKQEIGDVGNLAGRGVHGKQDELWRRTEAAWNRIMQDRTMIQRLYRSMDDRIEAVIAANGGSTRY